jgi:hypothetical protein
MGTTRRYRKLRCEIRRPIERRRDPHAWSADLYLGFALSVFAVIVFIVEAFRGFP